MSTLQRTGETMKTFKMLSFQFNTPHLQQTMPLTDGIIINQENSHNSWLLELYLPNTYRAIFDELHIQQQVFDAKAVISFPDNEPAHLTLVVSTIKDIGDHISVLLKGTLRENKKHYAEQLLKELLKQNLSDEELLKQFHTAMMERS